MRWAAVVIWFVLSAPVLACSFTPGGDPLAVDAAEIDGADDGGGGDDGPGIDAATLDGPLVDAAIDAVPIDAVPIDAAPIDAPMCTPGCDGSTMVTCPAGPGGSPTRSLCDLGCFPAPVLHCGIVKPSNLTAAQTIDLLGSATGTLTFVAGETYGLQTDTGEITYEAGGSTQILRAAGANVGGTRYDTTSPTIAVLAMASFNLPVGARLNAYGRRGVIFLSRGDATVGGIIDFTAGCELTGEGYTLRCGGPGGGDGGKPGTAAAGCAAGPNGTSNGNDAGGAGGGFATAGASGGAGGSTAVAAGVGGCGDGTLIPLRGGGGGGAGGPDSAARGGGAGGAIQITALGTVTIQSASAAAPARLNVGGAGGRGTVSNFGKGGGGGGAGGGLLIEGRTVVLGITDLLAAGGGGGGGRVQNRDGGSATTTGTAAPGGGGDGGGNGSGGDGAIPTTAAQAGGGNVDGTGGGGGGLGRIRINTKDASFTLPAATRATGIYTSGPVGRE